jgi:hypothetical protein
MKLTIAKKMFIGYLTMALLTVVVGIYGGVEGVVALGRAWKGSFLYL